MPHVETFTMTEPDDMHCHLRRDDVMRSVAHFTARQFARAVIMPNTIPPILTADDATRYFGEIIGSLSGGFEPLMTIQINELTTPAIIIKAKKTGVVEGKV
ncbi:MAG: dihydroorotase, partial [Candidatus Staskawiczbacteria bacterium]|nr:dihydroorotase [Candidatus Staskawiczbacteria bacterium]